MANELVLNRATVLAKTEATYGTDPTLDAAADLSFVREGTFRSKEVDVFDRLGISPRVPGFRPYDGLHHALWDCVVEMQHQAITGAAAAECFKWMRAAGFESVHNGGATEFVGPDHAADAVNDQITRMVLRDYSPAASSSLRIQVDQIKSGDAEAIRHLFAGARSDWALNIVPGEPWLFSCVNGHALVGTAPANAAPTLTNPYSQPTLGLITGKGCSVALIELDGDTVYGGGSFASPSNDVLIRSASFVGNTNPVEDVGISGVQGLGRIRHGVEQQWTASLVLEMVGPDDFNFWQYVEFGTVLRLMIVKVAPGNTSHLSYIDCSATLTATPAMSVENDIMLAQLDIRGTYPEVSTDGGGLVPASSLEVGWVSKGP